MYGADSRASCHPSELINVAQGLVFLTCLISAGEEAMALVEPPLILSDGLTCAFLSLCQTVKWKQEGEAILYICHLNQASSIYGQKCAVFHFIVPLSTRGTLNFPD